MDLPKEIREQFAQAGRRGGQKKVAKGFAKMDPARHAKVAKKGQKISLKARKAKKRAGKRTKPGTETGTAPGGTGGERRDQGA
jgi:hypothetical protein